MLWMMPPPSAQGGSHFDAKGAPVDQEQGALTAALLAEHDRTVGCGVAWCVGWVLGVVGWVLGVGVGSECVRWVLCVGIGCVYVRIYTSPHTQDGCTHPRTSSPLHHDGCTYGSTHICYTYSNCSRHTTWCSITPCTTTTRSTTSRTSSTTTTTTRSTTTNTTIAISTSSTATWSSWLRQQSPLA